MKPQSRPVWRSLLYVPAHVDRYVEKAHNREADAVILDLEDSVPPTEKEAARRKAGQAAEKLAREDVDVVVRINRPLRGAIQDLEAVVNPWVRAVAIPKVESASHVRLLSETVAELERERGMALGSIGFIGLIESVESLWEVREIAAADGRMLAIILGAEDFANAAGMDPDSEGVLHAKLQLVLAARSAGIIPLGLISSVTDYKDLERLRSVAQRSRSMGFEGATCVHPSQIPILNDGFSPRPDEVARARRLVGAYEQAAAQGLGALEFEGRMVDEPVVQRAMRLIELDRRFGKRSGGA